MGVSLQMVEVAIGWEVYALHRSALDLGWIGLAEFLPLFFLALPAGQLADRAPRRLIPIPSRASHHRRKSRSSNAGPNRLKASLRPGSSG